LKTNISDVAHAIKRQFVRDYCPKDTWCKDCEHYKGRCTHPEYPGTTEEIKKKVGERLG
jgi:hypothetical protein